MGTWNKDWGSRQPRWCKMAVSRYTGGAGYREGENTFWAPEILWAEGCYHMYVSYITGVPTDWDYPRQMLHYTSDNLWDWRFQGSIDLNSERVIDACVYEIAPHQYKMWYKDEEKESRTYAAVSRDLYHWHGLAVYRSDDFTNWIRCADILVESGIRPLDKGFGHHADVLVRNAKIREIAMKQSALDLNCRPEDFLMAENRIMISEAQPGIK